MQTPWTFTWKHNKCIVKLVIFMGLRSVGFSATTCFQVAEHYPETALELQGIARDFQRHGFLVTFQCLAALVFCSKCWFFPSNYHLGIIFFERNVRSLYQRLSLSTALDGFTNHKWGEVWTSWGICQPGSISTNWPTVMWWVKALTFGSAQALWPKPTAEV